MVKGSSEWLPKANQMVAIGLERLQCAVSPAGFRIWQKWPKLGTLTPKVPPITYRSDQANFFGVCWGLESTCGKNFMGHSVRTDNGRIIPHNPTLLHALETHLNVEVILRSLSVRRTGTCATSYNNVPIQMRIFPTLRSRWGENGERSSEKCFSPMVLQHCHELTR